MEMIDEKQQIFLSPLKAEYVSDLSMTLCSMDPWRTLEYTTEAFELYLLRADVALNRYVVMVSRKVAGVLSIRSPWLFGPFIELIALFNEFQGKGIGSQLVEWSCDHYRSTNLWAAVSSFNLKAQEFYSKTGFQQIAVLEDLIKGGWNEILLRKRVAASDKG
jgi:ribosomal protein S18 acetylase RimI-like enzyme